jgi:hypothetical protein
VRAKVRRLLSHRRWRATGLQHQGPGGGFFFSRTQKRPVLWRFGCRDGLALAFYSGWRIIEVPGRERGTQSLR